MAKKAEESCTVNCPIYDLIQCVWGKNKPASKVAEHLSNARVEVLLAVRSMIDSRIEELRGKAKAKAGGRTRRIKVTEKN